MTALLYLGGLAALVAGAELLVRGASRLALALGISPLAVGLTVVAFGTSAPELAVSLVAAATGKADLAFGNVVGSNILNVFLVLGLAAVVAPLVVSRRLVRVDVPICIAASFLAAGLALDGRLGRADGLLLAAGLAVYLGFTLRSARASAEGPRVEAPDPATAPRTRAGVVRDVALTVAGLALLVAGSDWLVTAATDTARAFGVPDLVIGLTVVAVGTSLPEIVTSLVAAFRGQRDIAVGNAIGSNLFNLLGVLGISAAVAPHGVSVAPAAMRLDVPVMLAAAVACLPVFVSGHRIGRSEGALFLVYYAAYVTWLVHSATRPGAPSLAVTLAFVVPLVVVTGLVVLSRRAAARRARTARLPA
jgi:cation:H+ antiporter